MVEIDCDFCDCCGSCNGFDDLVKKCYLKVVCN